MVCLPLPLRQLLRNREAGLPGRDRLPTVTVSDATFTYDGQNHTIVVNNPNNDDVKFSLSQSGYGAQIEKKAAGTYVIYWQATKEDKNVSGSATLVINKQN